MIRLCHIFSFFLLAFASQAHSQNFETEAKVLQDDAELIEQLNEGGASVGDFESYIYNPAGRRSPFKKPFANQAVEESQADESPQVAKIGLEGFDVETFTVTSILWSIKNPKALVKDPSGKVHLVEEGVKIGLKNGYVSKIREGELIVIEKAPSSKNEEVRYTTQVLKIGR